jgi:hypothetical protein
MPDDRRRGSDGCRQKSSCPGHRTSRYPTGYRALYRETHKLLDALAEATMDGTRRESMKLSVFVPLLIVDDLDMRKLLITAAEDMLEIGMRRY